MALGAALATGKPQAYCGGARPRPAQLRRGAAHRLRHERAGAGADRANPARRDRPRARPSARNPRPGRHHRAAGRSSGAHPTTRGSAAPSRQGDRVMRNGRPGPAALECAIDVWGKRGEVALVPRRCRCARRASTRTPCARPPSCSGKAKRVLIVGGGGAQDASPEVTQLSRMLQAPVLAYRRGRGVLDGRDPFSVTLPLGRELWGEADAVLAVGTRLLKPITQWGVDKNLQIVRVDADPRGARAPAQAGGRADRRCRADPAPADRRACRVQLARAPRAATRCRSARPNCGSAWRSSRRSSPSSTRSAPNCRRTASLSTRSRRSALPRASPFRSTSRARSSRPAIRTISAGAMPPRSARSTRGPTCRCSSINGDGGFLYTGNEMATAMRHRIPLVAIVFADGAFGNVRRIQEEHFGNRLIASDLANPGFRQIRRKLRRRRPARARPGGAARGAAAAAFAAPRADPDRSAGRADALALGIHPHAARSRGEVAMSRPGSG